MLQSHVHSDLNKPIPQVEMPTCVCAAKQKTCACTDVNSTTWTEDAWPKRERCLWFIPPLKGWSLRCGNILGSKKMQRECWLKTVSLWVRHVRRKVAMKHGNTSYMFAHLCENHPIQFRDIKVSLWNFVSFLCQVQQWKTSLISRCQSNTNFICM